MSLENFIHPYMPNSAPKVKKEMLKALGVTSVEDLYGEIIPDSLRFKGKLDLPEPIRSEFELKEHVMNILNRSTSTEEFESFLGAGCYRHFIPALCDEIAGRAEFLTGYCGDTYSDHGKMQAIFEYTSMMGELLDMDVVSYTCYDASQAAASSMRMALRLNTGRDVLLVPSTMNPEVFSVVREYCRHVAAIEPVASDSQNGLMDLEDLEKRLKSGKVAAVYCENPSYLGFLETGCREIADIAHAEGALCIVSPEIASLGVMESPANYGADIICGDIQPLGMHIQFGGGQAGFIASRHEKRFIEAFPTYMYGICETKNRGEFGWGRALNYRCSHGSRENANEYFGTETGLWAITAAVYLAALGPEGMRELGEAIMQNAHYASKLLSEIPGLKVNLFGGPFFQEFIVNFDETGKTVSEVNRALLSEGIFGGKDLSHDFPRLKQSALFCCTEITTRPAMNALAAALKVTCG
ncbi:MAG: aminomethyl-transferring glycine dehydrogenase subunit GcvPA [Synergistaceae bacterium]|nr:aminomethyl-transferring glycine dehydrogenase subunit GcvPA [Synergistaceae bacterium]